MDLPPEPRIVLLTPRAAVGEELAGCLPGFTVHRPDPAPDPRPGQPARGGYALAAIDFDAPWDAAAVANRWWDADPEIVVVGLRADRAAWHSVAGRLAATDRFVCLAMPFAPWEVRQTFATALEIRRAREERRSAAFRMDEARRALAQAREEADSARRAKLEFIANVNHEFRTPMNAVLGFTSLLLREPLPPEQADKVRLVYQAACGLQRLIDNLLDFSRLGRGQLELDAAPFQLDEVLGEVLDAARPWAQEKRLALECHVEQAVPRRLCADARRLRQVLLNLLDNAIKFTERGVVRLQVALDEQTGATATLRITVADTGVGVPPDREATILDCFTQADGSTTRRFGGVGLGLSLAKHLVDLMGGQLGFRSADGLGSSFWIVLPLATADPVHAEASRGPAAPADLTGPIVSGDGADLGRRRILVADDDRLNRALVELLLTRAGCFVDLVTDGREALDALGRNRYDLLLIDMRMPRLDGLEAIRQIRQREGADRRLRIVAMTADVLSEHRQRCLEAGADDYLAMPFTLESLFQTVQRHLAGWTAGAEQRPAAPTSGEGLRLDALVDCVDGLDRALDRGDFAGMEARAHALRGLAARAGWETGADHALRLQLAARGRDLSRAAAAAARLRRDFEARLGAPSRGDRIPQYVATEKDP